jgi:hypothetical protein
MLIAQNILLVRFHAAFYYNWPHHGKQTVGNKTLHQAMTDVNFKDLLHLQKNHLFPDSRWQQCDLQQGEGRL